MPARNAVPPLRFHSTSGRWYAWHNGRRRYFGHEKPAAETAYREWVRGLVSEQPAAPTRPPATGLTVAEAVLTYSQHAATYYASSRSHLGRILEAMRAVVDLAGAELAADFGAKQVKKLQAVLIQRERKRDGKPFARGYVNSLIRAVKTAWRWLAEEELVPAEKAAAVRLVSRVQKGRGGRETLRVMPPPAGAVEATLPHLSPTVRAMVEVQRLAGMRPGEVVRMRRRDVSTSPGELVPLPGTDRSVGAIEVGGSVVWIYVPESHKTLGRGKPKAVPLGPRAQSVLAPMLAELAPDDHVFSPARERAARFVRLRSARRSPVQPSQVNRAKRYPRKRPGLHYSTESYARAVATAAEKAGCGHWSPNQLRHEAATAVSGSHGRHAAADMLGHAGLGVVDTYTEQSLPRAAAVAASVG